MRCFELSFAEAGVSVCPCTNSKFAAELTAVVMKTLLPQTIGLECPRPGISVFQRMLVDFSASQTVGGLLPSAMPVALGPRNEGQFCADTAVAEKIRISRKANFILIP